MAAKPSLLKALAGTAETTGWGEKRDKGESKSCPAFSGPSVGLGFTELGLLG